MKQATTPSLTATLKEARRGQSFEIPIDEDRLTSQMAAPSVMAAQINKSVPRGGGQLEVAVRRVSATKLRVFIVDAPKIQPAARVPYTLESGFKLSDFPRGSRFGTSSSVNAKAKKAKAAKVVKPAKAKAKAVVKPAKKAAKVVKAVAKKRKPFNVQAAPFKVV